MCRLPPIGPPKSVTSSKADDREAKSWKSHKLTQSLVAQTEPYMLFLSYVVKHLGPLAYRHIPSIQDQSLNFPLAILLVSKLTMATPLTLIPRASPTLAPALI